MARKYLNDLGINDNFMKLDPKDSRWNKEIEEYGFPDYETWCLDIYFYCWLYERLKMLHGCELALSEAFENKKLTEDEEKSVCDIPWIWAMQCGGRRKYLGHVPYGEQIDMLLITL